MMGAASLSHFKEKQQQKKKGSQHKEYNVDDSELSDDNESGEKERPKGVAHMMSVLTESDQSLLSYHFDITTSSWQ